MSLPLRPSQISLVFLLCFWALGLSYLDRFPKIHEDEAWQAAPGYTFWAEGRFGADLFAGFYGMEQHYYGFMPLFPILVGGALQLFGLGLFQARLVPLALTLLTLALTYRLGAKLFSPWHGSLAVAVLVTWRVAGPFPHLVSGIPLADVARIVRYDSAVPVFGLGALSLLAAAGRTVPHLSLLSSLSLGFLAGLAALSHVYGAFWLPALWVAMTWVWGRLALKPGLISLLGFGLALTPWLLFVGSGWADFIQQNRNYTDRFGLLDARFYVINLLNETERYDPILNGAKQSLGAWLWLIGVGLSLGWLLNAARQRSLAGRGWRLAGSARILTAVLLTLGGLFSLLLSFKTFSYLATLWPLFALVIAAGFIHLWRAPTLRRWWRPALSLLLLLAATEGLWTHWQTQTLAQQNTPYQSFTQAVAAQVPAQHRVMGLQHYWLGLTAHTAAYQSILVPIFWTDPRYVSQPRSFAQAAQANPPQIILLDQIMLDFLTKPAGPEQTLPPLAGSIWAYLEQQQARLIGQVDDPTYGRLQIYELKP